MRLLILLFCVATWNSSASAMDFIHPGGINSKSELDFVKARIKAGVQPERREALKSECGANSFEGTLPSIPTLGKCDKPSPHDAAKSPCRMHSKCVNLDMANSTCR